MVVSKQTVRAPSVLQLHDGSDDLAHTHFDELCRLSPLDSNYARNVNKA